MYEYLIIEKQRSSIFRAFDRNVFAINSTNAIRKIPSHVECIGYFYELFLRHLGNFVGHLFANSIAYLINYKPKPLLAHTISRCYVTLQWSTSKISKQIKHVKLIRSSNNFVFNKKSYSRTIANLALAGMISGLEFFFGSKCFAILLKIDSKCWSSIWKFSRKVLGKFFMSESWKNLNTVIHLFFVFLMKISNFKIFVPYRAETTAEISSSQIWVHPKSFAIFCAFALQENSKNTN